MLDFKFLSSVLCIPDLVVSRIRRVVNIFTIFRNIFPVLPYKCAGLVVSRVQCPDTATIAVQSQGGGCGRAAN